MEQKIKEKVAAIHKVLGIEFGPTHVEIMVSDSGDIEMIEFNLRLAGADSLEIMSIACEQNLAHELLRMSIGEKPHMGDYSLTRFASSQYLLAPETITTLNAIDYPVGTVLDRVHVAPGTELSKNRNQIDWVGSFLVESDSAEDVIEKVKSVRRELLMNGETVAKDINNQVMVY